MLPPGLAGASGNLLRDPNLASLGAPDSPWQTVIESVGLAEVLPSGTDAMAHLAGASVSQSAPLAAGLYELTGRAKGGHGHLVMRVDEVGERWQPLGADWGLYGYLFEAPAGTARLSLGTSGDGMLTEVTLVPASAQQRATWVRQQDALGRQGFAPFSAQRPTPPSSASPLLGALKPLPAMTSFAVLDEPRLDTVWATGVERLVSWLGVHGFDRVDGNALPAWMVAHEKRGDAYSSVVVLPRGITPAALLDGPAAEPAWLRYLRAGGRIVHLGDLPFYKAQSPVVAPLAFKPQERGMGLLRIPFGWDSPYWGQADPPVTETAAGRAWGLETADGPMTGMPVETISLPFHVYTVRATGRQGATDWFVNARPDMPWSGLVKLLQGFDGESDAALRDVWRASHYVGEPVPTPPMPPHNPGRPSPIQVDAAAGGMAGRHEFVRCEKVTLTISVDASVAATAVHLTLSEAGEARHPVRAEPLIGVDVPLSSGHAVMTLDTSPYADSDYTLIATALPTTAPSVSARTTLGIRLLPADNFDLEIWSPPAASAQRTDMQFADIHAAGMELHLSEINSMAMDSAIRNHLGFSVRAIPTLAAPDATYAQHPEYYRLDPSGQPASSAGRPMLGISHSDVLAQARTSVQHAVQSVAAIPAFRPYVLTNDDFQVYYGWDYSAHVLAAYRRDTGMDAPRKMARPPDFGPISDDDPWVTWFRWTLTHVDGGLNQAEMEGAKQARPDVSVGPIPGPMQTPLVQMWEPSQYPTYSFGPPAFNLISYYYYNVYWQPISTATFWMDLSRMDHRDLPQWTMPDAFTTAGYTRNNLFHVLAGGARGVVYFTYQDRNTSTWPELARLALLSQIDEAKCYATA